MVSFGEGDVEVLAWSPMHGASAPRPMALADIISFLARRPEHALVRALSRRLCQRPPKIGHFWPSKIGHIGARRAEGA